MSKIIEKKIDDLESKFSDELDKLRKELKELPKTKDLFSITTYSEVCKELKEKEETCPYKKVKQLEKLFNQGWIKDWINKDQYKYYPYFTINEFGRLVFRGSGYGYASFGGEVGFYKDKQTSDHIGKNFISIYEEIKG